jgi:GDP-4-dehydro-6-deoxy-D-mannose reductase
MRALVTGANGFVGRWLGEHLEASGDDVWRAVSLRHEPSLRVRQIDLTDQKSVAEAITWAEPEAIYHLAAVAFGPDASADIGHAIDVTVRGTAFVLSAAAEDRRAPIVMIPSSSEVYEPRPEAIDERETTSPHNVYGATKLAQEALGMAMHRSAGLPVVVARAFNHIGPGQQPSFVVSSFASQLAKIANGAGRKLHVGNLAAERDFTDVRDVVRAYRLLVSGRHVGRPVNVGSGIPRSVKAVLDQMIELSGLDVELEVEPSRFRPVDAARLHADHSLLTELTGWMPTVPWRTTLSDILNDALRH